MNLRVQQTLPQTLPQSLQWAKNKTYKAVIFDLDGTLVDSMWIWRDIDDGYLIQHGYSLPDDLQKQIEGMSTTETANYFKQRFNIQSTIDEIKAEWILMAHDYYAHKIPLKSGAREFLDSLRDWGVKMGIGTSNFRDLAELVLKKHEVLGHMSAFRTSCEVDRGKPFPDVFLKVAQDLGVEPWECLVFEDTHAGVLAARAAGMDCISIADELSEPYFEEIERDANWSISDFNDLLVHIKKAPTFGGLVIE